MQKRWGICFLLVLLFFALIPFVSGESVDDSVKKITYYAEEYETGNINYAQLMVYLSSAKGNLNLALGAAEKQEGGILREEQLKPVFGEPVERTRWVWVEKAEKEIKVDEEVPVWKKIVFDGKKIQIRIDAYPSIFVRDGGSDETEVDAVKEKGTLVYRLHFTIEFKKSGEQMDVDGKINEIQGLAKEFNANPSRENAERLARESVNAEKSFQNTLGQSGERCEEIMKGIFGAENQRGIQKMLISEAELYAGENFDAIARLEMCDECEWNWVNLDLRIDGRGPGFKPVKEEGGFSSPEEFKPMNDEELKRELRETFDEIRGLLESGNYDKAMMLKSRLWALNDAWNQKSNDAWEEVEREFEPKRKALEKDNKDPYWWIGFEKEKRARVKEIAKSRYEERKVFYNELFAPYEKKEYYSEQIEFERRLVEEFKEFGRESCDNNLDDNNNGKIDCGDEQCGGKICGKKVLTEEGGSQEKITDLYCINSECSAKEEKKEREAVCGNHICERGENVLNNSGNESVNDEGCPSDCISCPEYNALECNGRVVFSGVDEKGCNLQPICVEENVCRVSGDCPVLLCGQAECLVAEGADVGECRVGELTECREAECVDGEERVMNCESGERLVTEICNGGIWAGTGVECVAAGEPGESGEIEDGEEPVSGDECGVREDCGGVNDVCSNGRCVALPENIGGGDLAEEEPAEESPEELPQQEEQSQQGGAEEPQQQDEEPQQQEQETTTTNLVQTEQAQQPEETGQIAGQLVKSIGLLPGTGFIAFLTGADVSETTAEQSQESQEEAPAEQPSEEPGEEEQTERPEEEEPQQPQEGGEQTEGSGEEQERREGERRDSDERKEEQREEQDREERERRDEQESDDRERREGEERERRVKECGERCQNDCENNLIMPCVGDCVFKEGEEGELEGCKSKCRDEKKDVIKNCLDECSGKCEGGEGYDFKGQEEEHKEEKGVFKAGGNCRTSQQKKEGSIYFDGWGEPFNQIQPLKQKYYSGGDADWCKWELENLKKQREEFEKSFNHEFLTWFFERYLASSPEDWEEHVSGIFELYWMDVDMQRETAFRMKCLGLDEMPDSNLININYSTEYGSVEFWEEAKEVEMPGIEGGIKIISPYMKIWVFPPEAFVKYQMKEAMKKGEFPGPPEKKMEREREGGLGEEEREAMRENKGFMKLVKKVSDKYNGELNVNAVIKDFESGEIVFNLYVQVNENEIMNIKPMLPESAAGEDARIEIDFKKVYELIAIQEREMKGVQIESPPWDKKKTGVIGKVKEVTNGVKMYFKVRDIINSAKVVPEDAEDDVKSLAKKLIALMGEGGKEKQGEEMTKEEREMIKEKMGEDGMGVGLGDGEGRGGLSGKVVF